MAVCLFKSFYHLSTLDVTHARKCTRPSPLFSTASNEKLGMGLGTRLESVIEVLVPVILVFSTQLKAHEQNEFHVATPRNEDSQDI